MFATPALALARARWIQHVITKLPLFGVEYDYVCGSILLRLLGKLTPAVASQWAAVLGRAAQCTPGS